MKNSNKSNNIIIFIVILFLFIAFAAGISSIEQNEEISDYSSCQILMDGSKVYIDNDTMAVLDGYKVILGKCGTYRLGGSSDIYSIVVNTEDLDDVNIIFENVTLKSDSYSSFYVEKAKDVNIFLEGENQLADGYNYTNQVEGKPNSCIYSKADMSISGMGSLEVVGNYHHAVSVRGDLTIKSGDISITSARNGIDVKDELNISGGDIVIVAANDGISAGTKKDDKKGTVNIVSGHIDITAGDDGVFAKNQIDIGGGKTVISSGGELLKSDGNLFVNNECVLAR